MKAYSFVEYACLYFKQVKMREWITALKFTVLIFVIIKLMAWTAEGLLIIGIVFVLYRITKAFWGLIMSMFREAKPSLLQCCG